MKQHNIDFLEQNRKCYVEVVGHPAHGRSATLARKIDSELLNILREEFMPGYPAPSDCGDCLFNMVTVLYEKFDAYMATRKPEPVVVAASFPENKPPVDPDYAAFLEWKKSRETSKPVAEIIVRDMSGSLDRIISKYESPEERKARLSDPNRIIKRRAKRK